MKASKAGRDGKGGMLLLLRADEDGREPAEGGMTWGGGSRIGAGRAPGRKEKARLWPAGGLFPSGRERLLADGGTDGDGSVEWVGRWGCCL